MREPGGVTSLADIEHDLEGAQKRAARIESFRSDGRPPRKRTTRDMLPRGKTPRAAAASPATTLGADLIARRPAKLRSRYQTILHLEAQHRAELDFAPLIASACQVLEAEISQLLVGPAEAIADRLVQLLDDAAKTKQAEILNAWARGRLPATIGTASLVLMALRYGLRAEDPSCRAFLAEHFQPGYADLVASKQLGKTLDRIRENFRNPACHGYEQFELDGYLDFERLLVARRRLSAWVTSGPRLDDPPGSNGLLHHHLVQSRLVPSEAAASTEAPTPLERLLALGKPRSSRLQIRLEPQLAEGHPAAPEMLAQPAPRPRPFRLGDSVRFAFQAAQDCELVLIDIGTSGNAAVALPNAWQQQTLVQGGQAYWLPSPAEAEFELTLSGHPGRERVVALAWREGPSLPLQPDADDPFRLLTPREITRLCDTFEALPADQWAACVCEFEVLA